MSSYDNRFGVHYNQRSHYTNDPEIALALLNSDPENGWCEDGYADYQYLYDGRTTVTRRSVGNISRSSLEFIAVRAAVQNMIADLRSSHAQD